MTGGSSGDGPLANLAQKMKEVVGLLLADRLHRR
jgi:hypothetical protein